MSDMSNGGRVTTREFYDALLDQNKARSDMELRLVGKLDGITSAIAACEERAIAQDKRIDDNHDRLNDHDDDLKVVRRDQKIVGGANAFFAAVAGLIGLN